MDIIKKAETLSVISSLLLAQVISDLFDGKSDEVTISKDYFMHTIAKEALKKSALDMKHALDLLDAGIPSTVALIMIKLSSQKKESDNKGADTDIDDHLNNHDCENCDAAEDCPIKDEMQRITKNKSSESEQPSKKILTAEELLKHAEECGHKHHPN